MPSNLNLISGFNYQQISSTKFLKWSVGVGSIQRSWGKIQYSKDCAAIPLRSLLAFSELNYGNGSFSLAVETKITKVANSYLV
jgi:hypothetical protein